MNFTFAHNNLNVYDLEKSLDFYQKALNLKVEREKLADDESFKLVYCLLYTSVSKTFLE